jgi:hypothetical protein
MALNFPDSPSDGDTFNGYSYNSSKGAWVSSSLNNTGPIVSDTAPSNPINGDFWFDSSSARLYMRYDDGSSSQWLSLSKSGADGADGAAGADGTATVYANTSVLPSSGNVVGNLAFATLTKSLHIWDGTEWDRVSTGNNETPRLTTTPASTHTLNSDGTNTAITIVASDPEGFPVTYSHDTNPASPNQVTNIVENNGVFTLVPSTNTAHAGNFTLRLKASDGVSTISHPITVALGFSTTFTFDTSSSVVNTNYTADNKVEAVVSAGSPAATSQQSGKLGKGYFELKMINIFNTLMVGVQVAGTTGGYQSSGGAYTYASNGGGYPGGSGSGGSFTDNDIIMVAYDTAAGSNGQIWFGKNGTWKAGVVPGTNAGYDVGDDASTVGFRPAVHNGSSSMQTAQVEIISHTQGAQYTIPTGWELA